MTHFFLFFLGYFSLAAEISVHEQNETLTLRYFSPKNEMAFFQVYRNTELLQHEIGMGSFFQSLSVANGEQAEIFPIDLNKDKNDELLVRSFWEVSSGIEVYKWDSAAKKFKVMQTSDGDTHLLFSKDAQILFDPQKFSLIVREKDRKRIFQWKKNAFIKIADRIK